MASRKLSRIHQSNQENLSSRFASKFAWIEFSRNAQKKAALEGACHEIQSIPKHFLMKTNGALPDQNANSGQISKLLIQTDQLQQTMPPPRAPAMNTDIVGGASKENKKNSGRIVNISARSSIRRQEIAPKLLSTTRRTPEKFVNVEVKSPIRSQGVALSDIPDERRVAIALDNGIVTSQESEVTESSRKRMKMTTRSCIAKQESVSEHKEAGGSIIRNLAADPMMVTEYTSDIFKYLRSLENKFPIRKDFLEGQAVTPKMRLILVDWLVEIHNDFGMMPETLYLCISIVDRYMQENRKVTAEYFQLVGTAALLVAAKYEETHFPALRDLLFICPDIYSKRKILIMEADILKTLNFNLGRPLTLQFLRRYNNLAVVRPLHHALGKYILELALMKYELCHVRPSLLAAAVCCLSIGILEEVQELSTVWTPELARHSGYEYSQLEEVVMILADFLVESQWCRFQTIRMKYSSSKNLAISTCPLLIGPLVKKLIERKMATT